jgi:hypothetical protein
VTAEVSEWLKIMLEEIARKKAEAEQILTEDLRRRGEAKAGRDTNAGGGDAKAGGEASVGCDDAGA